MKILVRLAIQDNPQRWDGEIMSDEKDPVSDKKKKNNEIRPLTPEELRQIRGGTAEEDAARRRPIVVSDPHRWPRAVE